MIYLSFVEKCSCRVAQPLTREKFQEIICSEQVTQVINQLKTVESSEERSQLKSQLPAFIFMAQMTTDGKRPKATDAVPTGLCMHDFDHLPEEVSRVYISKVEPALQDLDILLCHKTPSGKGLRLVTRLQKGESVADCQERVANSLGLDAFRDAHVKDLSRLSFAFSEEYLLYLDPGLFELPDLEQSDLEAGPESAESATQAGSQESSEPEGFTLSSKPGPLYHDKVPMGKVAEEVIKRMAPQGEIREGNRNSQLYKLVREMRPVFGTHFDLYHELLADYFTQKGLDDGEIRRTIASALGSAGAYVKSPSPFMVSILDQLEIECSDPEESAPGLRKLPPLPKIMEDILKLVPANLREPGFLALLPMIGTLATKVRFSHIDSSTQSLSFLSHAIAPPASNKSFVGHLFKYVMNELEKLDQLAREKDEAERQERLANLNSQQKQTVSKNLVRILPARITAAQLYYRLGNANGHHLIIFTDEVSGLVKSMGGQYGQFSETLRKAFDNAKDGKETLDDRTANFYGEVYLNTITCGTEGATRKFFQNAEDGFANRVIPIVLPDNLAEDIPIYHIPSEKLKARISEMALRLMNEPEPEVPYCFKQLGRSLKAWMDATKAEYLENFNKTWRRVAFRSATIGLRAAIAMWVVAGKPDLERKNSKAFKQIEDIMLWTADYVRQMQYSVFGSAMTQQLEAVGVVQRTGKNELLFSKLPEVFSINDIMTVSLQEGSPKSRDAAEKAASRWCFNNYTERVATGKYRKKSPSATAA